MSNINFNLVMSTMTHYFYMPLIWLLITGIILLAINQRQSLCLLISRSTIWGSLVLFVLAAYYVDPSISVSWKFVSFAGLDLKFMLVFDTFSRIMALFILIIGVCIVQYSQRYLQSDVTQARFLAQINFVVMAVLLLALAGNLFTAFIAWQFIGISLYLLLNHYHFDIYANKAAKKKFIINRVGDICFLIAIILVYHQTNNSIFSHLQFVNQNTLIALLILIAVMTKTAQFPFHIWLPDTLETPTPVSALMHAGVINAGGILLLRCAPLYEQHHEILLLLIIVGAITALLGNIQMRQQYSIKKQLAYSTMGQMGYMTLQIGSGMFTAALFHLIAHGFVKGYWFLSSGEQLVIGVNRKHEKIKRFITKVAICLLITASYIALAHWVVIQLQFEIPILFWGFLALTLMQLTIVKLANHKRLFETLFFLLSLFVLLIIYLVLLHALVALINLDYYWLQTKWLQWLIVSLMIVFQVSSWLYRYSQADYISLPVLQSWTEYFYRQYLLNPLRAVGEKLNLLLKQQKSQIRIIISLLIFSLYIIGCYLHYISFNVAHLSQWFIAVFVSLCLLVMIIANRATSIRAVLAWLTIFQFMIISIVLFTQAGIGFSVIVYYLINVLLVIMGLVVLMHNVENNTIKSSDYNSNKLTWSMMYLSTGLLFLIGIPGTASYVGEVIFFSMLLKMNIAVLIIYALTMLMLAVVIMHALQIHVFQLKKIGMMRGRVSLPVHLMFIAIFSLNCFCGTFPDIVFTWVRTL